MPSVMPGSPSSFFLRSDSTEKRFPAPPNLAPRPRQGPKTRLPRSGPPPERKKIPCSPVVEEEEEEQEEKKMMLPPPPSPAAGLPPPEKKNTPRTPEPHRKGNTTHHPPPPHTPNTPPPPPETGRPLALSLAVSLPVPPPPVPPPPTHQAPSPPPPDLPLPLLPPPSTRCPLPPAQRRPDPAPAEPATFKTTFGEVTVQRSRISHKHDGTIEVPSARAWETSHQLHITRNLRDAVCDQFSDRSAGESRAEVCRNAGDEDLLGRSTVIDIVHQEGEQLIRATARARPRGPGRSVRGPVGLARPRCCRPRRPDRVSR